MNDHIRVAVIGGGQNCEHEVSLASAASVAAALDRDRYEVISLMIDRDGRWLGADGVPLGVSTATSLVGAVRAMSLCDVVLPVVHGPLGEDGALAALCALAGIPCAGSPLRAGALAMDKWATKLVAEAVGIATSPGRLVTRDDLVTRGDLVPPGHAGAVVVKPVASGSSHGVSVVHDGSGLWTAVAAALELDERALIEELIVGREIDLAIAEQPDGQLRIGPPMEIVHDGALFDTATKYDGTARLVVPTVLDHDDLQALRRDAERIYRALGCRGIARVDFFLTDDGPVLNEVNTMPGMTDQSQVPRMFEADGVSYSELLDAWIQSTLRTADVRELIA